MDSVLLKLLGLVGLLIPMLLASVVVVRRRWAGANVADQWLVAALSIPACLITLIVAIGSLPFGRPLDFFPYIQAVITAVCAVFCIREREMLVPAVRDLARGIAIALREASYCARFLLVLAVGVQIFATLFGVWYTPFAVDELAYHIPQAAQAFQDGRVGPVQANVIWADSYPRGVALLYFWTLRLLGSDAGFHPVNATFGLVFMLATYVAGMRLGMRRDASLVAAGLIPTTPMFFYLSFIGYIDLSVCGTLAGLLAFVLPERDRKWSWGSAFGALLCAVLALWMKFPPVVIISMLLGLRWVWQVIEAILTRADRSQCVVRPVKFAAFAAFALALGAIPYARTWIVWGSPVYPVRLRAGDRVVFDGPMDPSRFGRMNDRSTRERFSTYWCNWYSLLYTDSPGSLGPLFTLGLLPAVLVVTLNALRRLEWDWLLLFSGFWIVLALPEYHVPRYGIHILLPGALALARLLGAAHSTNFAFASRAAVFFLVALNLDVLRIFLVDTVRWNLSTGYPLFTAERNRAVLETTEPGVGWAPNSDMRKALYAAMRDGETLVTVVEGLSGRLYDSRYRYRVEHRPARAWPYGFSGWTKPQWAAEQAPAWRENLLRDKVAMVMVYSGSAEELQLADSQSGYYVVHEQGGIEAKPAIRLYRRSEKP